MMIRKIIFWIHLAAGLVAGVVIAMMAFTGVMLAFEKEIIAWAERGVRRITPPSAEAPRLPLEELAARVLAARPEARSASLTLYADPRAAILVSQSRTNAFHVNPCTGAIQPPGALRLRGFMQVMIDWHRYLARHGESRPAGKAVTGACNLAFLFLGVSGLYLWWPRQWTRSALRAVTTFNFSLRGKARDWNWHNVIGLWCAPVLIVLTATAAPISYQWAGRLIHTLTGTQPPVTPALTVNKPGPDARPLGLAALVEAAQKVKPDWQSITTRVPNNAQPLTLTVKEKNPWPLFATIQLTLDPHTAAVLREESYAGYNTGFKVRRWTRFLHTGEALGPAGQAVAGLASLGGVFLVWTGFALAWRRFFTRKPKSDGGGAKVASDVPAERTIA